MAPELPICGFTIGGVKQRLIAREILLSPLESFRADKVRATMTALGMVIGTASLILVVTISLSGKQYVLLIQIQNIGANLIWVEYAGLGNVGYEFPSICATISTGGRHDGRQAAGARRPNRIPCSNLHERITIAGGKQKETSHPRGESLVR